VRGVGVGDGPPELHDAVSSAAITRTRGLTLLG
jgi:hypothetical protein